MALPTHKLAYRWYTQKKMRRPGPGRYRGAPGGALGYQYSLDMSPARPDTPLGVPQYAGHPTDTSNPRSMFKRPGFRDNRIGDPCLTHALPPRLPPECLLSGVKRT